MAADGEDVSRLSIVSNSIRLARSGDDKIDAMSVVADIVAMGTRSEGGKPPASLRTTHAYLKGHTRRV